jgi:tetratricopeptide (TPR) repeat protein
MQPQPADTVVIPPRSSVDFPLRAVFDSEILYAMEGRLTGEVKVSYEHKKNLHTSAAAVDFALRGKNYLTWDDPGKAAAFATTDDPLLQKFVDQALAQAPEFEEVAWFSRFNMSRAMIIFNALKAYGMKYRPDEVTPYPNLADTSHGALYRLDTIQYPGELLLKDDRAGDCDDLSVLYATMLQYAGLPAALVTGPGHGHIFIMFDTKIPAAYNRSLPVSPNLFIKRQGTLWIPIETILIPTSTFSEAWPHAANVIDSTWQPYEMASSQSRYPPVKAEVLNLVKTLPPIPDFAPALQKDFVALDGMKAQWLQKIENTLERAVRALSPLEAAKARNIYGVLLGQNDEYGRAHEQLQKLLAKDSTFAPAWNNLGNVEFITGNFSEAETYYKTALRHDASGRGTHLNLAILYQMMKQGVAPKDTMTYQHKSNIELLNAAQSLLGDAESAFDLLQFPAEERADSKGEIVDTLKKRIRQIKRYIDGGFKKYVKTRKIEGIAIDRSGAKGRDETDTDRSALLAWNY